MAPENSLDLAIHIVRTAEGVRGTLGTASAEPTRFQGWLGLTAAIARALDAVGPVTDRQVHGETTNETKEK